MSRLLLWLRPGPPTWGREPYSRAEHDNQAEPEWPESQTRRNQLSTNADGKARLNQSLWQTLVEWASPLEKVTDWPACQHAWIAEGPVYYRNAATRVSQAEWRLKCTSVEGNATTYSDHNTESQSEQWQRLALSGDWVAWETAPNLLDHQVVQPGLCKLDGCLVKRDVPIRWLSKTNSHGGAGTCCRLRIDKARRGLIGCNDLLRVALAFGQVVNRAKHKPASSDIRVITGQKDINKTCQSS